MKYSQLQISNSNLNSFSLSFTNGNNQAQWYTQQKKIIVSEELKLSFPSNSLFNITSLVFNHEKNKEEESFDYKCLLYLTQNALCLVIDKHMKYAALTKDFILNLLNLGKGFKVETIILLINKENSDYVRVIKGMMIVGFAMEKRIKTTVIEGQTYRIMKMSIKCTCEIEDVDF